MPDYSQFAPDAAIIPRDFPTMGQALMFRQQREDEQNRWLWEQQQRQEAIRRQEQYRMSQYMQDLLDPAKYKTGAGQIQALFDKNLADIQQKFSERMKNYVNEADFEHDLYHDVAPLIQMHANVSKDYENNKAYIDDLAKSAPDLAIGQVNQAMTKGLVQNALKVNPDGSVGLKSPDEYQPFDFVTHLQDPLVASQFVSNKRGFTDILNNVKGQDIAAGTRWGNGNETNFKGNLRSWEEPAFDYDTTKYFTKGNVNPSTRVKGNIVYANGQPVNIISPDAASTMLSSDMAQRAFYKQMFTDLGIKSLEQWNSMPQEQKDLLTGQYLYNVADANKRNFNQVNDQRQPGQPVIHISNNTAQPNLINDVYAEISNKLSSHKSYLPFNELSATAQKALLDYAKPLYGKVDSWGSSVSPSQGEVAIYKGDNGQILLVKAENGQVPLDENGKPRVIAPLNYNDVNMPVNNSVKQKQQLLKNQQHTFTGIPEGGF